MIQYMVNIQFSFRHCNFRAYFEKYVIILKGYGMHVINYNRHYFMFNTNMILEVDIFYKTLKRVYF